MPIWNRIASFEHPVRRMLLGLDERNRVASASIRAEGKRTESVPLAVERRFTHLVRRVLILALRLESIYFAPITKIRSTARRVPNIAWDDREEGATARSIIAEFSRQVLLEAEADCGRMSRDIKSTSVDQALGDHQIAYATAVWRAATALALLIQSGFQLMPTDERKIQNIEQNLKSAYAIARSAIPPVTNPDCQAIRLVNLYLLSDQVFRHQSAMMDKLMSEMRALGVSEVRARNLFSRYHVPAWLVKQAIRPKRAPWLVMERFTLYEVGNSSKRWHA